MGLSIRLGEESVRAFLDGVHSRERVAGLTHAFYKYPARFSPRFARAAIQAFTLPGDFVLDPFMGGATTIVEASTLSRFSVGLDINSLSCFIAKAKTTILSDDDLLAVRSWTKSTARLLNMRRTVRRANDWIEKGYQRNISTRQTWAIRKSLELALARITLLQSPAQETFSRALLLRTAQWALDCRKEVPSVAQFREALVRFSDEMIVGAKAFRSAICSCEPASSRDSTLRAIVINRSAEGVEQDTRVTAYGAPKLILTSPPYPGVHVTYHRWQILGRRETPAPFWIANSLDGSGLSYYTFGGRHRLGLTAYFDSTRTTFGSLARIADGGTLFVQMLAFSDASWQLPEYLAALRSAGLEEVSMPDFANCDDGRLWRSVPNRKWYADQRGNGGAGKEVVLFHRKVRQ